MTFNRLRAGCAAIAIFTASNAFAAAQCSDDVRVLAQPRDGLTLLEEHVDEFEKLSGAGFEISYLNENDRRAKSQADASTVGSFDVYYVDEANLALFASSGWIGAARWLLSRRLRLCRFRCGYASSRDL